MPNPGGCELTARRNRYPSNWESLLPTPGNFKALVGHNLAPRAEQPAPPPTASPAPAPLQTAAEIAAKAT